MLAIRSNVRSTYESWLKTSNLPYDEIDDIFAEEELEKTISGQDEEVQNDPMEDPTVEENDLPDITDAEGLVLEFQEEFNTPLKDFLFQCDPAFLPYLVKSAT